MDARAHAVARTRATPSSRGSCAATACTRSARRRAARTSASASAAARRPSRSWETPARAPAGTAPSSRASTAIRSTRSSPARSPRPPRAWACSHVVVTSVDRDDLPDRGAEHWARTMRALRRRLPEATVEVLTPDFLGREEEALATRARGGPDVFNHNIETCRRIQPKVRIKGDYERALSLLRRAREMWDERYPERGPAADQVGHRRRHGRDRRRDHRDDARPARARRRRGHDRPVPAAEPRATCRSTAGCRSTASAASARRARRWASARSSRARSCARATAPTSSGSRRRGESRVRRPARLPRQVLSRRGGMTQGARQLVAIRPAPCATTSARQRSLRCAVVIAARPVTRLGISRTRFSIP